MIERESVGGEDFLNLAMWCEFRPISRYEAMIGVVNAAKQAAKDPGAPIEDTVRTFKGEAFRVAGHGAMHGGLRTDYRLECKGVTICIRADADGTSGLPNVMVHVGSTLLMAEGLDGCWSRVQRLVVECLGARILRHSISRVDFCVDLPGLRIDSLTQLTLGGHYCSRLRGVKYWSDNDSATGIQIGKGSLLLRVYDKAVELTARSDPEKRAVVKRMRWGGVECEHAMRVEWQIRGQALRSMRPNGQEVRTVEEWREHRASVLRYLCERACRFVEPPHKKGDENLQRAPTLGLWVDIDCLFQEACGPSVPFRVTRVTPGEATSEQLCRMALGCLIKAAAQSRRPLSSLFDLYDACQGLVLDTCNQVGKETVMAKVRAAVVDVASSSGLDVEPWKEFLEFGKTEQPNLGTA